MSKLAAQNGAKSFSVKETAAINEANAKAAAKGADVELQTARSKLHVVPTQPAHGATEKAPHTKRAIQQAKTPQAKFDAAKAALDEATAICSASKQNDPERTAKFTAKAEAEQDFLAAKKALLAEQRKSQPASAEPKVEKTVAKAKAPKAEAKKTIKVGPTEDKSREGSWRAYMIATARAHKTTDEASAAHKAGAKKANQDPTKPLDFGWMNREGYIILN